MKRLFAVIFAAALCAQACLAISARTAAIISRAPRVVNGPVVLDVTNAQKLGLSPSTPVGTQVRVIDGFIVSGLGGARDGFYFDRGDDVDGNPAYIQAGYRLSTSASIVRHTSGDNGDIWQLYDPNLGSVSGVDNGSVPPFGSSPWEFSWTGGLVLTHPAVQTLNAPSSAQGGVFGSGVGFAGNGLTEGVYSARGTANSREFYNLLGQDTDSPDATKMYCIFWNGSQWTITNSSGGNVLTSSDDVATPDLVTTWVDADSSPSPITVTSVTAGQAAAGIKYSTNTYTIIAPVNGRNAYHDVLNVAPDYTWDGTKWTDGTHNGTGNTAFPWSVTGITITQGNVAAEANWSTP